jgi:hypothetical protein
MHSGLTRAPWVSPSTCRIVEAVPVSPRGRPPGLPFGGRDLLAGFSGQTPG